MKARTPERSIDEARLRVPSRSQRFIRRPRVSFLLDEAVTHPLTIVTGPAGTGKTLAVADWTREGELPGPPVWVSCDRGDSDPARFWASVVSSLVLACGADAVRGLTMPDGPDSAFLAGVAAKVGGALVLILDDVHDLDPGGALDWLDRLLRWPPPGVHLILISRHDPPIALARLRLEGKLAELRFADLAFTTVESVELLREWGVHLSDGAIQRLMDSTGGWAAAIRLAALTLRVVPNPSEVIERFGGPTFLVSEYLWDEVLHLLPERYSEFLLRTSIANRLSAPLAAALTGEEDSDVILRTLVREELLVQVLEDSGWYRAHSLMTEALRARLLEDRPDEARELNRRAALWFESRQVWIEALRHAVASEDWEFAGGLALRSGAMVMFGAERSAFVELMAAVPGNVAEDYPELIVAFAVSAYLRRAREEVLALLRHAGTLIDRLPEPRQTVALLVLRFIETSQAHRDGDAATMVAAAAATNELLSGLSAEDAPGWAKYRGVTVATLGVAELWSGRPERAVQLLRDAVTVHPAGRLSAYSDVYYHGLLALAQVGTGLVATARSTAGAALGTARAQGRTQPYEAQWAWAAEATAALYAGDEAASREAVAACQKSARGAENPFVATQLRLLLARRALMAGATSAARAHLDGLQDHVAEYPLGRSLLTAQRLDIEMASGALDRAREILDEFDRDQGTDQTLYPDALATSRARLLIATGRPEEARPVVAHLLEQPGVHGTRAWLAVAQAEDRLRRDSRAIEALSRALDFAVEEEVLMPFLQPAPSLAAALRRHLEVVGTHRAFVERALATASAAPAVPPPLRTIEPPTERERSVLAYLPTIGSNAEIADALSISENTVKQHLKSIYRKLGVGSRREAVRVAREHGLVPWPGQPAPINPWSPPSAS